MRGDISETVEILPLNHPEALLPAITICPTYGVAYNSTKLKVKGWKWCSTKFEHIKLGLQIILYKKWELVR